MVTIVGWCIGRVACFPAPTMGGCGSWMVRGVVRLRYRWTRTDSRLGGLSSLVFRCWLDWSLGFAAWRPTHDGERVCDLERLAKGPVT